LYFCFHYLPSRVIGQPGAQLSEDLRLVAWVSVAEDSRDVRQLVDDGSDLRLGHALADGGSDLTQADLITGPFGLGLGDPRGDRGRARPGIERGAVLD
jgi:hypothetical protein